jgi:hypothetical protein
MPIVLIVVAILLMPVSAAAHRTTNQEAFAPGARHWCSWSIAKTCTRWRAGARMTCTGPNDMRSGCIAQRKALR